MKNFNLRGIININNAHRLEEIDIALKQIENNTLPCKMSNKLLDGRVVNHRGERFLLKDGSNLFSGETTKRFTRYLNIETNQIEKIQNNFTSFGNIDNNKKVYTGPLFYSENYEKKFNS